jgi:hypothetical protein
VFIVEICREAYSVKNYKGSKVNNETKIKNLMFEKSFDESFDIFTAILGEGKGLFIYGSNESGKFLIQTNYMYINPLNIGEIEQSIENAFENINN